MPDLVWSKVPNSRAVTATFKQFIFEITPLGENFSGSLFYPGFRYRVRPAKTIEETIVLLKKKAEEL